jgi:predicted acetyltransferase
MPELLIAPAESAAEGDEALRMACEVFSGSGTAANYPDYKAVLWREDPTFAESNVMIARTQAGKLAGVIRIVPRQLHRAGQAIWVAGISSVCVAPAFRGRGYSVPLMEHTLDHCQSRGFALAFLIARRAADHYYTRFGFWGVSSYTRVAIATSMSPEKTSPAICFPPAKPDWIDDYRTAYLESYSNSFGWFERDYSYWKYLLKRMNLLPGVKFLSITRNGVPLGYVVKEGMLIREVAILDALPADELVHALVSLVGAADPPLQLDIPPEHRLCRKLQGFDASIRFRECSYGGHMLRILDVDRVADMLAGRVAERLGTIGCARLSGGVDGVDIRWDGTQCRVNLSAQARHRPGYEQTCTLLGALSISGNRESLVDRLLPFNISFPDQV